jgi:hypothetical protein
MNPDFPPNDHQKDTFRCAPMAGFHLGNSAELAYSPLQNVARLIGPREYKLLTSCSQFATLADHANRLIDDGLPARHEDVLEILGKFAESGMMLSHGALLDRLGTFPSEEAAVRLSWFAIPTSGRPKELARALESYAANFSRFGRSPKCLVAHDAASLAESRTCEAMLRSRFGGSIEKLLYYGPEEKRRLIALLAQSGALPRDVVEFGVLGPSGHSPTMGANRNVILLLTAGEMALSVDDDTICQPSASPDEGEGDVLRFGSEGDPTSFWFCSDRQAALASVRPIDLDIVAAHEELLGRPVWRLLAQSLATRSADLNSACGHLLEGIWSGKGRVFITLNGSVGDSGMYSSRFLPVHRERATRQLLVASEEAYDSGLRNREIVRQSRVATVCHSSPFMGMFVGIDNRSLTPPFFPAYRNEDGTYGYLVSRCHEDCFFGYLPWSLVHAPPGHRAYFGNSASTVRISDLVIASVSQWTFTNPRARVADRLRSLGRHLIEIASMEPDEFDQFMRKLLWMRAAQRIGQMESLVREYGGYPQYWAADLQREIKATQAALVRPDYIVPIDLPGEPGSEARLRESQNLIRRYGELLQWWPEMIERAKDLAAVDALSAVGRD